MIEESIGPVLGSSAMYETDAWGNTDQDDFINIALEVEHYMTPNQLLKTVNKIEDNIGRVRLEKWGPRLIDIDIIFMEDIVVDTKTLTIPHRLMHKRNFVLYPMVELAADFIHPVLNEPLHKILKNCKDDTEVRRIELY